MRDWIFFPLWGLELAENGLGLEKAIFGDATVVTRSFIRDQAPAHPLTAAMMSGEGLRRVVEASPAEFGGPAPVSRLIDIPPDCFIAVRRRKPEDAVRYAESVRTLLTASFVLTSGQAKGFAMTPLSLHWAAPPYRVMLDEKSQLQTQYKIVVSNLIHLTPVSVTHKQLREAWNTGSAIQGSWRMWRNDPLSKVLIGDWGSLSSLRKRIRSAASTLARAMESTDMTVSTLFAVVALEMLLKDGATDFAEMEELASSIFDGAGGPKEISRLFEARHKVAHEAAVREEQELHSQEVVATWITVSLAAMAAEELTTVDELLTHLRGRVQARKLATQFREQGKIDLADQIETASTFVKKPTSKVNPNDQGTPSA